MNTPLKVLIGWLLIISALVAVVVYRYDLIGGINRTLINSPSSAETPKTESTTLPVLEAKNSPQPTIAGNVPNSIVNGKKLFEEKTCVLCHGATGKADTPTGQAMNATNLSAGVFKHNVNKLESKAYIKKVIEEGVAGTAMASFKSQVPNEQDRRDLSEYVDSLAHKSK